MKKILLPLLCCAQISWAQSDSLAVIQLDEIELKTIQLKTSIAAFPAAIVQKEIPLQWTGPQVSLQEYIADLPGLISFNRTNYAQDLRLSIRGFGARSAFGIRGIKLIVDGIPETTPDGQGQLDNVPLALLSSIELLRGPSAMRFGNAAGGVLSLTTLDKVNENFNRLSLSVGSYGMRQMQFTTGINSPKNTAIIHLNHARGNGYRENSRYETNLLNVKWKHQISNQLQATLQLNATKSPYAQDAGGQNLEEFSTNRKSARDRNLLYQTGEAIAHNKAGASLNYQKNKVSVSLYGFFAQRDFEGRLPFSNGGWVDLNRTYSGQGGSIGLKNKSQKWQLNTQLNYAFATQADVRQRFVNREGVKGEKTLNQKEGFNSFGVAIIQHLNYGAFHLNGGIRWDKNTLAVNDYFLINGDDSAQRSLNAWSPQIGLSYRLSPRISSFGNYSKSYETPTLSELSANPTGGGGFNPSIDIQVANNLEWGIHYTDQKTTASLVYFLIGTQDDLVAYELASFPGRTFYRNVGSTKRKGIELSIKHRFGNRLNAQLTYNTANFNYDDFLLNEQDYAGNELPGIPSNFGALNINYQWKNELRFNYTRTYRGELFADNANTAKIPSFFKDDITFGIPLKKLGDDVYLSLGCFNLLNVEYSDNIRINAFGNRYYEAAPKREFFTRLRWQF